MWIDEVPYTTLVESKKWSVEYFYGYTPIILESGYPLARLYDLVQVISTTIDPQNELETLFNYIGLENIESLTGDLVDFKPKYGREIRSRSKVFESGDILYGRLRPYLNKVYLAEDVIDAGICSTECIVVRPHRTQILPIVLRFILASSYISENVARYQSGAALPRLAVEDLLNMEIPMPPMEHQLSIEHYIRKQDARRKKLRKKVEQMPNAIRNTLMAVLNEGKIEGIV